MIQWISYLIYFLFIFLFVANVDNTVFYLNSEFALLKKNLFLNILNIVIMIIGG